MIENWIMYLWILMFVFAMILTISGILRWIANTNKRKTRLTVISICAFVFLVVMLLCGKWDVISSVLQNNEGSGMATKSLINISKITIKVLLLVLIVTFSLIIAFMAILLVIYSIRAIIRTISEFQEDNVEDSKEILEKETKKIFILLKTPIFITSIVGGIVALYLVLPLLMGTSSESLAECWKDGIWKIAQICTDKSSNNEFNNNFASNLSVYSLIFILIIGIGYGVVNILFEIIRERFKKNTIFLKEYSNSIGLLAIGISILLLISSSSKPDDKAPLREVLSYYATPFVTVIFIIALGILILEIVRLLIDMREKMIRKEARYLFVFLVGLCTVTIMKAFLIVYSSISSILGRKDAKSDEIEEDIQKICNRILEKTGENMEDEIEIRDKDGEVPYSTFQGKITKK